MLPPRWQGAPHLGEAVGALEPGWAWGLWYSKWLAIWHRMCRTEISSRANIGWWLLAGLWWATASLGGWVCGHWWSRGEAENKRTLYKWNVLIRSSFDPPLASDPSDRYLTYKAIAISDVTYFWCWEVSDTRFHSKNEIPVLRNTVPVLGIKLFKTGECVFW